MIVSKDFQVTLTKNFASFFFTNFRTILSQLINVYADLNHFPSWILFQSFDCFYDILPIFTIYFKLS